MRFLRRVLAVALVSMGALAGAVSTASATPPDTAAFSGVFADCSEHEGGSDALIMASGTLRRSITLREEDGEPVLEMRHFTFEGTLTGPAAP